MGQIAGQYTELVAAAYEVSPRFAPTYFSCNGCKKQPKAIVLPGSTSAKPANSNGNKRGKRSPQLPHHTRVEEVPEPAKKKKKVAQPQKKGIAAAKKNGSSAPLAEENQKEGRHSSRKSSSVVATASIPKPEPQREEDSAILTSPRLVPDAKSTSSQQEDQKLVVEEKKSESDPKQEPEAEPEKKCAINLKALDSASEDGGFIDEGKEVGTGALSPTKADREKDELIRGLIQAQKKAEQKGNESEESDSLIAEYEEHVEGTQREKKKAKYRGPKEYTNLFKQLKGQK